MDGLAFVMIFVFAAFAAAFVAFVIFMRRRSGKNRSFKRLDDRSSSSFASSSASSGVKKNIAEERDLKLNILDRIGVALEMQLTR